MNQDTFLFIFALLLAFATGNISYIIKQDQEFNLKDIQEINMINADLQLDPPFIRLDLNAEYPNPEYLKLLSSYEVIANQSTKKIVLNSSTCFENKLQQLSTDYLDKESLWLSFLCNQISRLPEDFFESAPFMHPNGKSYAYMFYSMNVAGPQKQRWYYNNARYMHINELKKISWPLDERYQFLFNLKPAVIDLIKEGEKFILADDFYLIRTGNLKYFVSEASRAQRSFMRAGFLLSQDGNNCFIKAGNVCWKKKKQNILSYLSETSIIIFLVTLVILFLTARALFLRVRRQKIEEERKKHALRVLTHELRTPVAALLLQVDSLTQKSSNLPEEVTNDIAKIESEIYRLKHLAEKSQSYLQTDSTEMINTTISEINLSDLCQEIKDEYFQSEIQVTGLTDIIVKTDFYWLKMCLINLVENAHRYGKPPITIHTEQSSTDTCIKVIDNGQIDFDNLKQIMNTKHKNSKGLGLGLKIIDKTLKALGGQLHFSQSPTTFTIKLKRGNHD